VVELELVDLTSSYPGTHWHKPSWQLAPVKVAWQSLSWRQGSLRVMGRQEVVRLEEEEEEEEEVAW
jgi:hypothetical protein